MHAPIKFNGVPYIRIGSATPKLSDYPDRERALWSKLQSYIWEGGIALQFVTPADVIELLDVHAYFHLLKLVQPENRTGVLQRLEQDQLISADVGGRWNILNLGALLLAHDLDRFPRLARKALRIVEYEDKSRLKTRRELSNCLRQIFGRVRITRKSFCTRRANSRT
jgi:predicted HTH transcriptional regulator